MAITTDSDILAADVKEIAAKTVTIFMNGADSLTTADVGYDWIPETCNGWVLTSAVGLCSDGSSSGNVTILVKKNGTSLLSTNITIEASETSSRDATTQPVIDTAQDDVATGDEIEVSNSGSGTGVLNCGAQLTFTKP